MDVETYINKLDILTWGFRIEKLQERDAETVWHIMFLNPKDKTWYSSSNTTLSIALADAVKRLERDSF